MKVSLITACFNSENSIKETIISVNEQTYNDIEHIFIDGKSSDNTLKIINKYSTRNKQIFSESDNGIYDAINKGLKIATGDIIGLVHSDDILSNDQIITEIINQFNKYSCDGVYGDLEYVHRENTTKVVRYWKSCAFNNGLLKKGWMPPHPTLFLKKNVYNEIGNFDLSFKIAADYDFILRIFSKPNLRLKYMPTVICKMKVGGESNKSLGNILIKSNEDFLALKRNNIQYPLYSLLKKNISKIPQFLRRD